MSERQSIGSWADLFHPVEHPILSEYLCVEPLIPVDDVDTRRPPDRFETYLCVEQDASGGYSIFSLPNAVARICVESVQRELPQWGLVTDDGSVKMGWHYRREANRPVKPIPGIYSPSIGRTQDRVSHGPRHTMSLISWVTTIISLLPHRTVPTRLIIPNLP